MAVITVGPGATNRAATVGSAGYTRMDMGFMVTSAGTIDTLQIYLDVGATALYMGFFRYVSGTAWAYVTHSAMGAVAAGSTQTFSGLSLDVQAGDTLAYYDGAGKISTDTTGSTQKAGSGNLFSSGNKTFDISNNYELSLYGSGTGPDPGWTGKILGVSNPDKILGAAAVDIDKVMGV